MAPLKQKKKTELLDVLEKEMPVIFIKDSRIHIEKNEPFQARIEDLVIESKPKKKVVKKKLAASS
jgi:hypothetical protein